MNSCTEPAMLTTRPKADAARDISDLAARGIRCIAAPMLVIRRRRFTLPDAACHDAVVLTSRHAAAMLAATDFIRLPCFAVGSATARAASAAGFSQITTGPGDGTGLTQLLCKQQPAAVFWPSAVDSGFDMQAALAACGIACSRLAVYKAAFTAGLPATARQALAAGRIRGVLAHSGRAGERFGQLLEENGLAAMRRQISIITVSQRAASCCGTGWHQVLVSETPRRAAMLELAGSVMDSAAAGVSDGNTQTPDSSRQGCSGKT